MKMYNTVSLTGFNSNDIYSLHYPDSLLKFCAFDFSGFVKRCTDFCKRCEAAGEYRIEDAVALRNSISACHKYYEANTHGIFEKIIPDFFIEYICRERGIGTTTLWNNLINSKNRFEKVLFTRLTEYRHNKAVNEWVNLLKIQEYAKRKLEFVFGEKADNTEASAKRDYFDLAFTVAANELGYAMNNFAAARLYSVGRLPSSPFIVNNIAKEIAKTALAGMEYPEEEKGAFPAFKSDTEAMEVFSAIKGLIPEKSDSVVSTIVNTMRSMPKKVYVAESFKAVIDLEIDLILESGGVLCKCARCGEYYLRNEEYDEDYCSYAKSGGKTCLEIATTIPPRTPEEIEELDAMTQELYTYMSKRINVDLTQRDFAEWYQYFMAIKENIAHRRLTVAEFRDFEKYSKELKFNPPVKEKEQKSEETAPVTEEAEPKVKPFVFERIDRSELFRQESQRRKREMAQPDEDMPAQPKMTPSISDIAQEPKTTVKVVKAEDTGAIDVSMFSNPFDGAFDEGISQLEEEFRSKEMKPLDDIFSFGDFSSERKTDNKKTQSEAEKEELQFKPFVPEKISPDATFNDEMQKASVATTRVGYAAGMYKKAAQQEEDMLFPDIVNDGERMTDDDFDILPGTDKSYAEKEAPEISLISSKPESEIDEIRREVAQKNSAPKRSAIKSPKIVLEEPKVTGNKTKRVLDGILTPVKNHNPFISGKDNED